MAPAQFTLSDLFAIATGVACPTLFFVLISYLLGLFVFGPLYAKATWTPPKLHFHIADILVLLVQLQLAAGLMFALLPLLDPSPVAVRVALASLVWILLAWWWWTGVRMLAKARVRRGADRLLFLSIVLPIGYLSTVGMIASPVLLVLLVGTFFWAMADFNWEQILLLAGNCFTLSLTFGSVFLVRWYCGYIVEHARDDVAEDEGIAFQSMAVRQGTSRSHPPLATEQEVRILDEGSQP